jgi:hypothetical protein
MEAMAGLATSLVDSGRRCDIETGVRIGKLPRVAFSLAWQAGTVGLASRLSPVWISRIGSRALRWPEMVLSPFSPVVPECLFCKRKC